MGINTRVVLQNLTNIEVLVNIHVGRTTTSEKEARFAALQPAFKKLMEAEKSYATVQRVQLQQSKPTQPQSHNAPATW